MSTTQWSPKTQKEVLVILYQIFANNSADFLCPVEVKGSHQPFCVVQRRLHNPKGYQGTLLCGSALSPLLQPTSAAPGAHAFLGHRLGTSLLSQPPN